MINKAFNYKKLFNIFIYFIAVIALLLTFRGAGDLRYYSNNLSTKVGSPFETTGNTARYALVKSIVEDKSLFLSERLAKFSSPDVVTYNNRYLSIFPPGVSFAAIPLYLIGVKFGLQQVFAYSINTIAAFFSFLMIVSITKKITKNRIASYLSGLIYILATNALVYASTFTQHMLATLILLISVYLALEKPTLIKSLAIGFLYGYSITIDISNAIILLPALIIYLSKYFDLNKTVKNISIKFNLKLLAVFIGFLIPLSVLGYYNYQTSGSVHKLAQMIGRSGNIESEVDTYINTPADLEESENNEPEDYKFKLPFNTRNQIEGLYILILSNERGFLFYYPVLVLSTLGLFFAKFKDEDVKKFRKLSLLTIGLTIVMYSSFGDPWGGWSFGARYLIPVNAMLSIWVGISFVKYARNIIFMLFFGLFLFYSLLVSARGAFTTTAVPPKGEALSLPDPVPYTSDYNQKFIDRDQSSSFVYNAYFGNRMHLSEFINLFVAGGMSIFVLLYIFQLKGVISK